MPSDNDTFLFTGEDNSNTWELHNNTFASGKPSVSKGNSNKAATDTDFLDNGQAD